ncbi:MAG: hypothetical protein Tsb0034_00430 [Ekhidna sp.]
MNRLLLILIVFGILSCGKDDGPVTNDELTITAWLDSANITSFSSDDNGIFYYSEVENPGGASVGGGDVVAIYYRLFDLEDNLLASRVRGSEDSLIFKHGVSAAYPVGMDIGVGYMRQGEVYSFLIPPSSAYQDLTSGAIASDQIVRLELELVGVFNENDLFSQEVTDIDDYITTNDLNNTTDNPLDPVEILSSGVGYKRLSAGNGNAPAANDTIVVDYTGIFLDGSGAFDSRSGFQWVFGSNSPRELLSGFEEGVAQMQPGENALVFIPSNEGYRESALVVPASITGDLIADEIIPEYVNRVPPYKTLIFNITRVR